jgi:Protein of unknown function (DUF3617)
MGRPDVFRGVCFATVLGLAAPCFAAGVSFDVKPGLWELQTSGSASGIPQIPPDALAKLPPDQRVIATAMLMAIVAQASMPHTLQFCVTPEQIRQGLDLNRMGGKDCQRTVQSSSPTGLDMQVDCTGRDAMSGTVHLRVVDRATLAGDVDVHAGIGANSMTIRQNLHGRWLGAACGDVKPFN